MTWTACIQCGAPGPAVVPVLIGPVQVLLAVLPGILVALAGVLVSLLKPSALKHGVRLAWRLKGPLVLVVLGGAGVVWAARAVWPDFGPDVGQAEDSASAWPMVRGCPARTGTAPGAQGPSRGGVNWVCRGKGAAFFASPALVGNRVYVTTAKLGVFGGSGAVLCLDADTGATVWESAPRGYRATFSSPVVAGERLVCGEGLHFTRDARVVCLDLAPGREGEILWTHRTASHVECAPVVAEGRVYVGAGDDGYYCFDLEPGDDGQARVVWHLPGDEYPDAETALAVHDGKVYAGLGLGGKALCVLDAATGREIKRLPTPYPVFSPPSIADRKLYLGMGNGDYVYTAEEVRSLRAAKMREAGAAEADIQAAADSLGPAGEVWCVDLQTLEVDWRFRLGRTVLGAVAVAGDDLYFGSRDGCLYGLGRDGSPRGKWNAHAPIITSPAVTDDRVYVMTAAGTLFGLDRARLEPVWEMAAGTEPLFISSPAVARGHVYVGTQADGFLCLGEPGGEDLPPLWPGRLAGPGRAGCLDASPLPTWWSFYWQYPPEEMGGSDVAMVRAPPAALGGNLYVPMATGPARGLVCLPVKAAGLATPEPAWTCPTPNGVVRSPAVVGDTVLVPDGEPGDDGRYLHAVNALDGRPLWTQSVAREASGVLAAAHDAVYVQDDEDVLSCLDPADGARQWSQPVGRMARGPSAAGAMLLAVTVEPPALMALDRPTGQTLWRVPLEAAPTTGPAVVKTVVYVGTARGLEARRLLDGMPVPGWRVDGGGVSADFALAGDLAAYVSDAGELVVVSRVDGSVLGKAAGAVPGLAPLVGRGVFVYAAKEGLMAFATDAPDADPKLWADTSWLGRPTSPMIVAASRIYGGMAGWGVVCLGAAR